MYASLLHPMKKRQKYASNGEFGFKVNQDLFSKQLNMG